MGFGSQDATIRRHGSGPQDAHGVATAFLSQGLASLQRWGRDFEEWADDRKLDPQLRDQARLVIVWFMVSRGRHRGGSR